MSFRCVGRELWKLWSDVGGVGMGGAMALLSATSLPQAGQGRMSKAAGRQRRAPASSSSFMGTGRKNGQLSTAVEAVRYPNRARGTVIYTADL